MSLRRLVLLCAFLVCAGLAQAQEKQGGKAPERQLTFQERIDHPDLTLKFDTADKKFSAPNARLDKQAAIKPFAFSKSAYVKEGFRTQQYEAKQSFKTTAYDTQEAAAAKQSYSAGDRGYATRDVPGVRDAPGTDKTAMGVRDYTNLKLPYVLKGTRQDTYDTIMAQKNLTIDQVRELLNKNR